LFGRDAEKVEDAIEVAVLDEEGVAAETGSLGDDDALRVRSELDLGEDLACAISHLRGLLVDGCDPF
jgi:hypothetical protein